MDRLYYGEGVTRAEEINIAGAARAAGYRSPLTVTDRVRGYFLARQVEREMARRRKRLEELVEPDPGELISPTRKEARG